MAPRLARGSKRRAWNSIPQRRQYQLNHLRHRAEKRGLSGGDGRRGACEWPCEATVQAWRVSSACGAHLVAEESNWLKVPPAGGAIRTSPGSGCGAVEETRPRDAVMIPRTISTERGVVLTSTFASSAGSACGRSWGKRRAPVVVFAIGLLGRLVDAVSPWLARRGGAHSSGAMRHDCGLCRDSPPSTSALCGDSGAFLHVFGDAVATYPLPGPPASGTTGRTAQCSLESPPLTPRRPRNNLDVSAND